jgi:ribosomal protein S18 acetylase RimI-like enzyme
LDAVELPWDSSFFGFPVFSLRTPSSEDIISTRKQLQSPALVYVLLNDGQREELELMRSLGIYAIDVRVVYQKDLGSGALKEASDIQEYEKQLTPELERLALHAGQFSRFKKDPRLNPKYVELYRTWIIKSLTKEIAEKTFVYFDKAGIIRGMCTCAVDKGIGSIGLIAVDPEFRSRGVGKALMARVEQYYSSRNAGFSRVTTQEANRVASEFYQQVGYKIFQRQNIFHLWI